MKRPWFALSIIGLCLLFLGGSWTPHARNQKNDPAKKTEDKCSPGDGKYCVFRKADIRTCTVWTASGISGEELLGPFDNKADAIAAMCKIYDPNSFDPAKCAFVDPADSCQKNAKKNKKTPAQTGSGGNN